MGAACAVGNLAPAAIRGADASDRRQSGGASVAQPIDVLVRGAGVFGLAIAWACHQRGARVRVVDPAGAGAGASGGVVGALAPHVPEGWNEKKAFQLDSLLAAPTFWAGVAAAGGLSAGYARTGRLQPIADAAALDRARARSAGAAALWGGAAVWDVVRAEDCGHWAPASPTGWLIRDTLSARIHPRQACHALAAALAAQGVPVVPEAPDAGAVVWATGAQGLAALSAWFGRPVGVAVKGQAALLAHDLGGAPQIFADGVHIVPHDDGTVGVGSTSEPSFDDPSSTDAALDAVIARARAAVPALADAPVVARWAGVRPRARSRAPLLGPWPGRPGNWIANGGFKIGFGMAPGVAQTMADAILGGTSAIPEAFGTAAAMGQPLPAR